MVGGEFWGRVYIQLKRDILTKAEAKSNMLLSGVVEGTAQEKFKVLNSESTRNILKEHYLSVVVN